MAKDKTTLIIIGLIAIIAVFAYMNNNSGKNCINSTELYETQAEAESASVELGCTGFHQHKEQLPGPSYMACENHKQAVAIGEVCKNGY